MVGLGRRRGQLRNDRGTVARRRSRSFGSVENKRVLPQHHVLVFQKV